MNGCSELAAAASNGVAPALRAVDCIANDTAATTFGRMFGANGALTPALTILLTLYIAFFAISLLTGRSRIGVSALTPRAMTLGLVLTFATSWIAYQSVVWNLAVGAPDQIASVLTGSKGSATLIFADRMDTVFSAIAEAATGSGQSAQGAGAGVTSGSFTPGNILWLGAILLLIGTVGVLVTARIALAVLLAVGPIFVVFALFTGTRGLTAGWLRGVVLTAIMPLFVVVGGGIVMELLVPIVSEIRSDSGAVDGRAALALFLIAFVHIALMSMIGKVTATAVAGWSAFGLSRPSQGREEASTSRIAPTDAPTGAAVLPAAQIVSQQGRRAAIATASIAVSQTAPEAAAGAMGTGHSRTLIMQSVGHASNHLPPVAERRARGVGSRFQAPPLHAKGKFR